jgi:hypothetical protein
MWTVNAVMVQASPVEALAAVIIMSPQSRGTNYVTPQPRAFDTADWFIVGGILLACLLAIGLLVWKECTKEYEPILKRTKNPYRRYKCVGYRRIQRK